MKALPGLSRGAFPWRLRPCSRCAWGWVASMVGAMLLIAGTLGCGVKGPPAPPRRPPLPAVEELNGSFDRGVVTLTWRHDPSARGVSGYVVLRAQTDPDGPPCPDCPLVYQRVGTIGATPGIQRLQYTDPVTDGYRYTYLVRTLGAAGDQGPDNASVVIDRSEFP